MCLKVLKPSQAGTSFKKALELATKDLVTQ